MTTESDYSLQLSHGYRSARKFTSAICALGLGWSAAQFELEALNFGSAVSVDLSSTSISIVLACGIIYMTARCAIEFAMQTVEVRQWRLAQTDLKLSLYLVRASLLMLAAGGLSRSVDMVAIVGIGALILLVVSLLLHFLIMIGLMPLVMFLRRRRGYKSVAASAFEANFWAGLVAFVLVVSLLAALGVASLQYEPLQSLWTVPPSPIALAIFVTTAISVVISVVIRPYWENKLFARTDSG